MIRILSLGAGVQSTTLALMAAHGEIEPPDCAIFADTQWEPPRVYRHLDWLEGILPFPVHRVTAGNIRDDIKKVVRGEHIRGRGRAATAPFWTQGADGLAAPLRRQCTGHYKIEPIEQWLKERLGIKPRQRQPTKVLVDLLIGISMDEIHRVKPAQQRWIERKWPLIFEVRMSRNDCLRWMERKNYPLPGKSSCIGCPYHNDAHWRDVRANAPEDFADAVEIDALIRRGFPASTKGELFMHRKLQPLGEVDFSLDSRQLDMFGNECEGMCGV